MISDEAIFAARTVVIDDGLYEPSPRLGASLRKHAGRYRFWFENTSAPNGADPESANRHYGVLRIDPDSQTISGDLFADIKRKDWVLSWRSQALFHCDCPQNSDPAIWAEEGWSLLAVCDAHHSAKAPSSAVILLALQFDALGLADARLIETNGSGNRTLDLSKADPDPLHFETYRHLKPVHVQDEGCQTDEMLRLVVEKALGQNGQAINQELKATGSGIYWRDKDSKLITVPIKSPFELLTPYQWSDDPRRFAVLFSSQDVDIYGSVLELSKRLTPLMKVRFGAVIYVRAIANRVLRGGADWRDHIDEIVALVQRTYLHEIGHLLNLPHTWQRGQFETPPMRSGPADISLMAYGSRFPLGDAMTMIRRALSDEDPEKQKQMRSEDADRANSKVLTENVFTKEEREWLRHAPFDHISPGGPYFSARDPGPPRLLAPDIGHDAALSIHLWDNQNPQAGGEYIFGDQVVSGFSRQVVMGYVKLVCSRQFFEDHPFHFVFQSPMLSLLVREEYPSEPNRPKPRLVKPIPARQVGSEWLSAGRAEKLDLSVQFHAQSMQPDEIQPDGRLVFYRAIPFIDPAFFMGFSKPDCKQFTLQAILQPIGDLAIVSEPVRLIYSRLFLHHGFVPPRTYSADEKATLTDHRLADLINAANYLPRDVVLENLQVPDRHGGDPRNAFGDLVERIKGVAPGLVSPKFFNILKGLVMPRAEAEAIFAAHPDPILAQHLHGLNQPAPQ